MSETKVPAYRWAKEIKKLDGNKCAFCGSTDRLEAHHITQKAISPEEATDLENGITLCHDCHYTAHGANYTTNGLMSSFSVRGFATHPKKMKAFIANYKEQKVVLSAPKGFFDDVKAHAESQGESMNAFINRAIMEVKEMDQMHTAYQRGLLRHLERMNSALEKDDVAEAKRLLAGLIEDTKADIGQ